MSIPCYVLEIAQAVHDIWCSQDLTLTAAVSLTFRLQNLIRLSVRACEYSLSVISKLFEPFVKYHGNNI